ncbi:GntR family transcriptional regulator [Celeribacter arenosi]|uniref:GntR family transcriptional regulator n=1 Tax=Celeribacter arenosi TaxID=792649 RepID=A0ABP7JVQ4_9RHOB
MTERPLAEQLADRLRRDILRGRLAPGDAVKERDNALDLNVSRTPMREAIRILAKEGLIVLRPARSPIVADPSIEEISQWVEVLGALEILSGDLACARASDAQIAKIRRLQIKLAEMDPEADKIATFETDMAFHSAIVAAARNPSLAATHRAYLERLWRVRYLSATRPDKRTRVLDEHSRMVDALTARDAATLRATIETHLASMLDNVRAHYAAQNPKNSA